jgi:hypothetical protein
MQERYMEKRGLIERELLRCATAKPMERPTYTELGQRVGIPTRGPWQSVLDAISNDADKANEPDLTFLIRNANTDYPSRMGNQEESASVAETARPRQDTRDYRQV